MQKTGLFLGTAVVILVLVSLADFSAATVEYSANNHFGAVVAIKEDTIKKQSGFSESFNPMVIMESPSPAKPSSHMIMAASPAKGGTSVATVVEYVDIGDKLSRL